MTGTPTASTNARAAISAEPFPGVGRVTISAGVADLALARDGEELYRNADQALYLAKRYGRDIVFLHQSNEVTAIDLRPHPWEFALYYDI